jgi:hypothetical protein
LGKLCSTGSIAWGRAVVATLFTNSPLFRYNSGMTSQNMLPILAFVGVLCVLVSLANGEFNRYGVKFGGLKTAERWMVGIFGLLLIVPSFWVNLRSQPKKRLQESNQPAPAPVPSCDATVTGSASTTGANSPATVAGCTGPSGPVKP